MTFALTLSSALVLSLAFKIDFGIALSCIVVVIVIATININMRLISILIFPTIFTCTCKGMQGNIILTELFNSLQIYVDCLQQYFFRLTETSAVTTSAHFQ